MVGAAPYQRTFKIQVLLENSLSYHGFMQVWQDLEKWQKTGLKTALTIGNFDGVHLGHQRLLNEVLKEVQGNSELTSLLLTFHPHPAQVLAPEKGHVRLFGLEDQQEQLQKHGLMGVFRQPFSREFSNQNGSQFLEDFVLKYFHPASIVVGHDFAYGANRSGSIQQLKSFCESRKIKFYQEPPFKVQGENGLEIVSTSNIREKLKSGNLLMAEKMLGRKYYLKGVIEKGQARGRTLGFPTANIRPDVDFYPKLGVYACRAILSDGRKLNAVMNLGTNKTFVEGDHQPIKAEVHILDFSQDLYGQTIKVELEKFLRDEKKFSSIEELKNQIQQDCQSAREVLK